MLCSAVRAVRTRRWLGRPRRSARHATPQESDSWRGSYRPWRGGKGGELHARAPLARGRRRAGALCCPVRQLRRSGGHVAGQRRPCAVVLGVLGWRGSYGVPVRRPAGSRATARLAAARRRGPSGGPDRNGTVGAMVAVAEFFAAITAGDVDRVRRLLDEDPGLLHNAGPNGASPALTALYNGHGPLADELAARTGELSVFEAAAFDDTARLAAADRGRPVGGGLLERRRLAAAAPGRLLRPRRGGPDAAGRRRRGGRAVPQRAGGAPAARGRRRPALGAGVDPDRLGRPGARPAERRLDPAALGGGQRRPGVGAGAAVGRRGLGGGQRRGPDADRAGRRRVGARGAARRRVG